MNTKHSLLRYLLPLTILLLVTAAFILGRMTAALETDQTASEDGERKVLFWQAPMDPTEIYDEPGKSKMGMDLVPVYEEEANQAQAANVGERKVLYWQAPMNPSEIYDEPGKSKMGMDLVPVYEGDAGSGGTVRIDPIVVQNMGIRTARVQRGSFARSIRTVGNIDYNEERQFSVSTKISGWIEVLHVDYTGQEVRKGEPLLEIYSPELVTTQKEFLLALKTRDRLKESGNPLALKDAESLLASAWQRLQYWDIGAESIDALEETGEVRRTLPLLAPSNGVVIHKNAVEGMHIKEGMDLYQIADLSNVWVYASIYDYEIPWIKVGQPVAVELPYAPGKSYSGRVAFIYPYLNQKARDVRIRMAFANPNYALKPGMYADVVVQVPPLANSLMIPSEAAIRTGTRTVVFVVREPGKFEPRTVELGEEGEDGLVRVINGLLEGEEVVTSAQFLLDSESRLQEAIQKMLDVRQEKETGMTDTGAMQDMEQAPSETMPDMPTESMPDMKQETPVPESPEHNHIP